LPLCGNWICDKSCGGFIASIISFQTQLEKCYRAGGGYIQRVDSVGHGYLHRVIAGTYIIRSHAITLGAHNDGKAGFGVELWVANGYGVITQRHGCRGKAQLLQRTHVVLGQKRPWHLKHRAHADAYRPAVKRIGAGGGQQHRVHVQRGGGAEDSAEIGRVHYVFQNRHAARTLANVLDGGQGRTAHGAEHTPHQLEAGKLRKNVKLRCINGNIAAAGDDILCLSFDVAVLYQHGNRNAARVQRPLYYLGTFGYENSIFWVLAV